MWKSIKESRIEGDGDDKAFEGIVHSMEAKHKMMDKVLLGIKNGDK